jgi:hypothetical protein
MPNPEFVEVRQGGEKEAVSLLIERLLVLPGNQGLVAELNDRPS